MSQASPIMQEKHLCSQQIQSFQIGKTGYIVATDWMNESLFPTNPILSDRQDDYGSGHCNDDYMFPTNPILSDRQE